MGILNFMDTTSEKEITPPGDNRMTGVAVGIVTENYSKDMPGRLRVKIPVRDEASNILDWAKVAVPYGGKEWGCWFLPEKDDQVLLAFEQGSIKKPYIIGSLPREGDKTVQETADEHNQTKKIITKNGNSVVFTDHKDGSEKDSIKISTSGDTCRIILDNEERKISIADKDSGCSVEMNYSDGEMKMAAGKKMTLLVGDSVSITMNGETGTVVVEADKVQIKAGRSYEFTTDGTAKLSGQQVSAEGTSAIKLSSSGIAALSGSPVKLG